MRYDETPSAMISIPLRLGRLVRAAALGAALLAGAGGVSQAQQRFASPAEAVGSLVAALRAGNTAALLGIFGPDSDHLVASGDEVADRTAREAFLRSMAAGHRLEAQADGSMVLLVGPDSWPMPIPLTQADGAWVFDAGRGQQEVLNRRIGRNELTTIQFLRQIVTAQHDFATRMQAETGRPVFARRFISTPGTQDGLIWETPEGQPHSPLGAWAMAHEAEGYPDAHMPTPDGVIVSHGYRFRILTAQGPQASGAPGSYLQGGAMTRGWAVIAWPAHYGASGIMTFIVSHQGVVYERNLGEQTDRIVARITRFDPDANWSPVADGAR